MLMIREIIPQAFAISSSLFFLSSGFYVLGKTFYEGIVELFNLVISLTAYYIQKFKERGSNL